MAGIPLSCRRPTPASTRERHGLPFRSSPIQGCGATGQQTAQKVLSCELFHIVMQRATVSVSRRVSGGLRGRLLAALSVLGVALFVLPNVQAQPAIIMDDAVALAVTSFGSLGSEYGGIYTSPSNCNTDAMLVRELATNFDALCGTNQGEGWGLAYDLGLATDTSCFAQASWNPTTSMPEPTVVSFTGDATSAQWILQCGTMQVTQTLGPVDGHPGIFRGDVHLLNVGPGISHQVMYRRFMGWGPFATGCCGTFTDLATFPLAAPPPESLVESGLANAVTGDPGVEPDYWIQGPPGGSDIARFYQQRQSVVWTLQFGTFLPGAWESFTFYYGVLPDEATARAPLAALGAQVYSLSYPGAGVAGGTPSAPSGPVALSALADLPHPIGPNPPPPPVAGLDWTFTDSGCATPVKFTDISTPAYAPIVAWEWHFGDGASSVEQNPEHIYRAPGEYGVVLIVIDENGLSASFGTTIVVPQQRTCEAGGQSNETQPRPPHDGADEDLQTDAEGDGIPDRLDNCPSVSNAAQRDTDDDGQGDSCDQDADNDGLADDEDNCPLIVNPGQTDFDGDGYGDACDADADGDKVSDGMDNCLHLANRSQTDEDGDGIGDDCEIHIALISDAAARPGNLPNERRGVEVASRPDNNPMSSGLAIGVSLGAAALLAVVAPRMRGRKQQ